MTLPAELNAEELLDLYLDSEPGDDNELSKQNEWENMECFHDSHSL